MNRYTILVLLAFLISHSAYGQANSQNWSISYYGDLLIHPGIQLGRQVPLKNWKSTKDKRSRELNKYKSINAGVDVTYYWHQDHHHGLILSPNLSFQKVNANGKYFQIKVSIGYHRSIVDGLTYAVQENEEVVSQRGVGQSALFNALSFDFGKDLRITKQKPLRWFFQIGINGRSSYNNSYLPSLHTAFGIHYFIKNR